MSKLITKARAGVTLVELLVVILIVTILSVSLLPLLKPYIEEAKYAAEPIPVIGSLQTKINLFQYEKDFLPCDLNDSTTWAYGWTNTQVSAGSGGTAQAPIYKECKITSGGRTEQKTFSDYPSAQIDWEDLKGRRMTPEHIQYSVIAGGSNNRGVARYAYALGAFGNGDGLGKGTGFASLVIVDSLNTNKIVATWKRYKPVTQDQVVFRVGGTPNNNDKYCYLPETSDLDTYSTLIDVLKDAGWDFTEAEKK